MNVSGIGWTSLTANPMSGCEYVSPECAFCYAESLAENKRGTPAFPQGFDLTFRPHRLRDLARAKSELVFMNSMSDPGLPEVLAEIDPEGPLAALCAKAKVRVAPGASYFDLILDHIRAAKTSRFQLLTKRPEAILAYIRDRGVDLPGNVWMGVTIGHQSSAWRLDVLKQLADLGPALIFLSCEPLLSRLDLDLRGVAWTIGGGESGVHATWPERMRAAARTEDDIDAAIERGDPWIEWWKKRHHGAEPRKRADVRDAADKIERRFLVRRLGGGPWAPTEEAYSWAQKLREDSERAGAAFFWKQWGGTTPGAAGRGLYGREHNGMPVHIPDAMPPGYEHKLLDGAAKPPPRRLEVVQPERPQLGLGLGLAGIDGDAS